MDRANDAPAAASDERLAACKAYMKVDYDTDDDLIRGIMDGCAGYLTDAGCVREISPAIYDLILHAMTLEIYDKRAGDAAQAMKFVPDNVRFALNQFKIRCNYGGGSDGSTGG